MAYGTHTLQGRSNPFGLAGLMSAMPLLHGLYKRTIGRDFIPAWNKVDPNAWFYALHSASPNNHIIPRCELDNVVNKTAQLTWIKSSRHRNRRPKRSIYIRDQTGYDLTGGVNL